MHALLHTHPHLARSDACRTRRHASPASATLVTSTGRRAGDSVPPAHPLFASRRAAPAPRGRASLLALVNQGQDTARHLGWPRLRQSWPASGHGRRGVLSFERVSPLAARQATTVVRREAPERTTQRPNPCCPWASRRALELCLSDASRGAARFVARFVARRALRRAQARFSGARRDT